MRRTERSIPFTAAAVLAAAMVGGLAGCEQQTTADVPAAPTAPAGTDSRSFMVQVVQPATQVLWNYGYAEKMSDENWAEVSKAATTLVEAMPTIAAGGFSAEEKARATQGGWQDWAKKTADNVEAAKLAADMKNQMGLATAGDSLVETCGGCHTEFDPNAKDPGAK
jgi:type IV pilus biogenesis protein CpaD/CtpE